MDVFRLLLQDTNERIGYFFHQLGFLGARCALGDLEIDVGHDFPVVVLPAVQIASLVRVASSFLSRELHHNLLVAPLPSSA